MSLKILSNVWLRSKSYKMIRMNQWRLRYESDCYNYCTKCHKVYAKSLNYCDSHKNESIKVASTDTWHVMWFVVVVKPKQITSREISLKAPLTTAWVLNVGAGCWTWGARAAADLEKFLLAMGKIAGTDLDEIKIRFKMWEAILVSIKNPVDKKKHRNLLT